MYKRLCIAAYSGSADDRPVLHVPVRAQEDGARRVRARGEHDGLVAAERDDDLRAFELLAVVRAALDRRVEAAPWSQLDRQQIRQRSSAGRLLDGDDAPDEKLGELFGFAHRSERDAVRTLVVHGRRRRAATTATTPR